MSKSTTQDERPLPPHVPRTDRQTFGESDIEKYLFEHQHTKGWGPIQSCLVLEQHEDGYCTVWNFGSLAQAWSGCLRKSYELTDAQLKNRVEAMARLHRDECPI